MSLTNKELAEKNYKNKTWTEEMLRTLVLKGKLTPTELNEILGVNEELSE